MNLSFLWPLTCPRSFLRLLLFYLYFVICVSIFMKSGMNNLDRLKIVLKYLLTPEVIFEVKSKEKKVRLLRESQHCYTKGRKKKCFQSCRNLLCVQTHNFSTPLLCRSQFCRTVNKRKGRLRPHIYRCGCYALIASLIFIRTLIVHCKSYFFVIMWEYKRRSYSNELAALKWKQYRFCVSKNDMLLFVRLTKFCW